MGICEAGGGLLLGSSHCPLDLGDERRQVRYVEAASITEVFEISFINGATTTRQGIADLSTDHGLSRSALALQEYDGSLVDSLLQVLDYFIDLSPPIWD
jgi:hypothetical protein